MAGKKSARKAAATKSKTGTRSRTAAVIPASAKENPRSKPSSKPTTVPKDPNKSPEKKKTRSTGVPAHQSPQPYRAATQLSGIQASVQAGSIATTPTLVRFDLHICASGQEFCRAPWTKPLGHKCIKCKEPVHSFCYGQHGESIPIICALCVSPIGTMAGLIAPVGKPDGFDQFYSSFLANEVDDVGVLLNTGDANLFTPSGLTAPSLLNPSSPPFTPTRTIVKSLRNVNNNDVNDGDDEDNGSNKDPDKLADDRADGDATNGATVVDGDPVTDSAGTAIDVDSSSHSNTDMDKGAEAAGSDPNNSSLQVTSYEQRSFDALADSANTVFSGNSDDTAQCKNTDRIAVRVFVCQMVPKFDKDKNFHSVFAACFNKFMSSIIALEPLIRLLKWTALSAEVETEAVTAVTRVKSEYKQYIYCSFRGESAGKKYLRIQLSIPADNDIDEILSRLQDAGDWWEGWNCFARQVGSDATQPVTIGWLHRSSVVHIGSRDLQNSLRLLAKDPLLGLEFQKISQKPRQVVMNYRKRAIMMKNPQKESVSAVHVEVQEGKHRATLNRLEKIYNGKDCPLGINFHFVRHIDMPKMQTRSGRGGHAKCVSHQYAFELMVEHASTEIHNIDKMVSTDDGDMSLRQALMALKVKTINNCIGDKLFLSINRESATSNTFLFEYHLVVEAEATELVEYLPVFIRDVFIANPKDYCDYGVCKDVEFMKWDESQRCGIDPEMEKFENFVDGLPDVIREDGEDGGFAGLDPLAQAMYKRAAGDCDETLMSDTSRHQIALGAVKNITGQQKQHSGVEINLDGDSIRSNLSTSTSTSKVDAAKQEITAEFTIIIDGLKDARDKEKDETNKVLEIMRAELANTRLVMAQQSALLTSLASAQGQLPPAPTVADPSSTPVATCEDSTPATDSPPIEPTEDATLKPPATTIITTTTSTIPATDPNDDQGEPGSGSNGAEST